MNLVCRLQNAAARSVRSALKRIENLPSTIGAVAAEEASIHSFRFALIPLALASFLAWAPPAAAIDTTNYVPFAAMTFCTNVPGSSCAGTLALPANRVTVLEYVSVICDKLGTGSRLAGLSFGLITEGVQTYHYLQLPVAASIGDAPVEGAGTGQVVRLYADPNTNITVSGAAYPGEGTASLIRCTFSFSGQQSPALLP